MGLPEIGMAFIAGATGGGGLWAIFRVFIQKKLQGKLQADLETLKVENQAFIETFKADHSLKLSNLEQEFRKEILQFQKAQDKQEKLEEVVHKYTGVILLSAKDLQDRLWHLLVRQRRAKNKVLREEDDRTPSSQTYPMTKQHYLNSTIFLFGQYFCWLEILKIEIRYLNFGDDKLTNDFSALVKVIERSLADTQFQNVSKTVVKTDFLVFQLMQTQIGCELIDDTGSELRCISFNEFSEKCGEMKSRLEGLNMLESLVLDTTEMAKSNFCNTRLRIVNNSLVDLIEFLNNLNGVVDAEAADRLPMTEISPKKRDKLLDYPFLNSSLKKRLNIES